jgi:hypothetical protein
VRRNGPLPDLWKTPRRESLCGEVIGETRRVGSVRSGCGPPGQVADQVDEPGRLARLVDEVVRIARPSVPDGCDVAHVGHHHDGQMLVARSAADLSRESSPVHDGHHQVDQHHVEHVLLEQGERARSGRAGRQIDPSAPKLRFEELEIVDIVVDGENFPRLEFKSSTNDSAPPLRAYMVSLPREGARNSGPQTENESSACRDLAAFPRYHKARSINALANCATPEKVFKFPRKQGASRGRNHD